MIFLIMILVILTFVALWNFDLHKIIYVKSLSQNAGDGAALAAARWQGITLNLIGDLNIMQAVALTDGRTNEAAEIAGLQARLCYVGPMIGFMAAQQAAKNNGVFNNADFTSNVLAHAGTVRLSYAVPGADGQMLFPEPYPDAWNEYADMIEAIGAGGVAAGPDNARYYEDYAGSHLLLELEFYDAVAGQDWCWFHHNAMDLLLNYSDYHWWPDLPERIPTAQPMNSEYFGLGLRKTTHVLDEDALTRMAGLAEARGLTGRVDYAGVNAYTSSWYCYNSSWGAWDALSIEGSDPFPATGEVLPQYDYAGADVAIRVETEATRYTPGASNSPITWTAAAKPFGYLNDTERPNTYDLVLPAFHDLRLIPVDASSAPAGGAFNMSWRTHIEEHLPSYMQHGLTQLSPGECWYCGQLVTWESSVFRQTGIDWLEEYSARCRTYGPGRDNGGGRRRGH
jgi:hypothetical protein